MDWPRLPFSSTEESAARSWDRDDLWEMSHTEFEELVADVWQDIKGCSTEVTQKSRDGGVDVIAKFSGLSSSGVSPLNVDKLVIQVKQHSSSISSSEIDRMEGVRRRRGADEAVFVTASRYTTPAEEAADDLQMEIVDGRELVEMLNESSLNPNEWVPFEHDE